MSESRESNIFIPILFCDYMRKNRHLLTNNLSKEQFKSIFDKLLLENFGELQTKHIILEKTLLKESSFEESIENNILFSCYIGVTKMYIISRVSQFIYATYYRKYLGGFYGFHNQKSS